MLSELIPSPINHSTHIPEFWLQNFVSRSPSLDMACAPSCFSLKIQKCAYVEALIGDGISAKGKGKYAMERILYKYISHGIIQKAKIHFVHCKLHEIGGYTKWHGKWLYTLRVK